MKRFYLSPLLALSILMSLGSGCIAQSSKSTSLEESNLSESKQDIPTTDQKEPVPVSKRTKSPIQPMSYWAIPFLSVQEAHQLYQMLDEDSKARSRELLSIHGVQIVDQTLTFKKCQEYFGEHGLFEHAKKVIFERSQIDVGCFEKLPKTLTDLVFHESQLIHHEIYFLERIWVKVLESIVSRAPHLQVLSIHIKRKADERFYFHQKATAVIAKKMTSLRHLTIGAFINEQAVKEIAQGNLIQLTYLDLRENHIGSEGLKAIATGNLANLTYLDVTVNNIKDEGIQEIAENMTQLRHLNLSANKIGPKGALALAHGKLENLTYLDLSMNKIGPEGAEAIFQGNLPSLTYLDVSLNQIGNEGAQAATHMNLKNLTRLNLYLNQIDRKEALTLIEDLGHLFPLKK